MWIRHTTTKITHVAGIRYEVTYRALLQLASGPGREKDDSNYHYLINEMK